MKKNNFDVKDALAVFVVFFGIGAIVFVKMEDMALGALIGFISAVIGYFFGSSKGSETKDKTIQDLNVQAIVGGNTPQSKDDK